MQRPVIFQGRNKYISPSVVTKSLKIYVTKMLSILLLKCIHVCINEYYKFTSHVSTLLFLEIKYTTNFSSDYKYYKGPFARYTPGMCLAWSAQNTATVSSSSVSIVYVAFFLHDSSLQMCCFVGLADGLPNKSPIDC